MKNKPVKAKTKRKAEATSTPPLPEFYLHELPVEKGESRASIHVETGYKNGTTKAHADFPSQHLPNVTASGVAFTAVAAPVAALGLAIHGDLPVAATVAVTVVVAVVAVVVLAWLYAMLRAGRRSK